MKTLPRLIAPIIIGFILSLGVVIAARASVNQTHSENGQPPDFYGIIALNSLACDEIF